MKKLSRKNPPVIKKVLTNSVLSSYLPPLWVAIALGLTPLACDLLVDWQRGRELYTAYAQKEKQSYYSLPSLSVHTIGEHHENH